jgi:hypothetical protein
MATCSPTDYSSAPKAHQRGWSCHGTDEAPTSSFMPVAFLFALEGWQSGRMQRS